MTEIERKLSSFRVVIGNDSEGKFVASSEVEPAFCISCATEAETIQAVNSIVKSYVKTFYHVEIEGLSLEPASAPRGIPVTKVSPKRSFLPTFGAIFNSDRTLEAAGC
ncbi:hypothetical protein G3T14_21935 [Methylobacterium sp. BTF04]|uniref:hypothetical protein n=1 Tax=Methylobacterium sp. BTF04 TaxID=2708300 RepID=UPI0013D68BD3|nr:hypothetical protein [Methylobacterium sp. BTF04]NEU14742.1 hypothetical protein [Methylobacterium sp. BTF04]